MEFKNVTFIHTLIAGVTGAGKSYCEHKLIDKIINEKLGVMYLLDPKRVELRQYKDNPLVMRYANDMDDIMDTLRQAESDMQMRYMRMEQNGQTVTEDKAIFVIVDETAALMEGSKYDKQEAIKTLYNIAFLGRAAKVFLVLCTQRSTADVLPRKITVNLENIVCLRQRKPVDSRELIGIPDACNLPKVGYCYLSMPDMSRPVKVLVDDVWERLIDEK